MFPALGKLLLLGEGFVVHLMSLNVVIEELFPLGGLLVVEHIPGGLLHASKLVQLLHTLPSLGRQLLVAGILMAGRLLVVQTPRVATSWLRETSDPSVKLFHWQTRGCPDSWLSRLHVAVVQASVQSFS